MRKSSRRLLTGGIAVTVALSVSLIGFAAVRPGDASAADASSAVTKAGDAAFPDVRVTVAKTKNLRNEGVQVSWSGAKQSEPPGGFRRNFMQIMQCWGDDPSGPTPEQCQFGTFDSVAPSSEIGEAVRNRLIVNGPDLPVDPNEKLKAPAGSNPANVRVTVPFQPADGSAVDGEVRALSAYFDYNTTNEIPVSATHADGKGQELFEVQTAVEAPGLGCGATVKLASGGTGPRPCWLVVVPRSDTEVDGTKREDSAPKNLDRRLQSSPLSASNWAHRIQFPLSFRAIPTPCQLKGDTVSVLGQENITEAFVNWQPSLCQKAKLPFEYSEVPDSVARLKLSGSDPALSIIGTPEATAEMPKGAVVAPIAVSGLSISYNWEVHTTNADPPEVQALNGSQITGLKLNQRLVLKLLTQSYRGGSPDVTGQQGNPLRLEDDPEFQALNPEITKLTRHAQNWMTTVITAINPADVNQVLWQWIASDPDARAFAAGADDGHGMKINPAYKDLGLDRNDFPKLDESCQPGPLLDPPPPPVCNLDLFPYSNTMNEAARAAARGDTLSRNTWDPFAIPPLYKKAPVPEEKGLRAVMVIADTPIAERLQLPMAALKNADGNYVSPTNASLVACVNAWKKSSIPGMLTPNPAAHGANVYPLANVSYAAVMPNSPSLTAAQNAAMRTAYQAFFGYALGAGQKAGEAIGQLPDGYVPMSGSLAKLGTTAISTLKNFKPPAPTPSPRSSPKSSGGGSSGSSGGGGSSGGASSAGGSASGGSAGPTGATTGGDTSTIGAGPTPAGTDTTPLPTDTSLSPTPAPSNTGSTATNFTPVSGVGQAERHSLIWVLLGGIAAGAAARLLPRWRALGPKRPPTRR
jgi:hypothetical protein